MPTLLFVHGTGVRKAAFEATFRQICRQVDRHLPGWSVQPCYWGDSAGASLRRGGQSIPDYETARSVREEDWLDQLPPGAEEQYQVLWQMLELDPLFELRLLSFRRGSAVVAGAPAPWLTRLTERLRSLSQGQHGGELGDRLKELAAEERLRPAVERLLAFEGFRSAAEDAGLDAFSAALARALAALLLDQAQAEAGGVSWAAADRLKLVTTLAEELTPAERGPLTSLALYPLKAIAGRLATWYLRRKRGALTDAMAPFPADILLYQARGERIRGHIRQAVEAIDGPVVLLAHSLGGIASFELLVLEPLPKVRALITAGSQAPFLYELDALSSLRCDQPLPETFPPWTNFFDRRDILSYLARPIFGAKAKDVSVDNGEAFPASHSAYWGNPQVWKEVVTAVAAIHE